MLLQVLEKPTNMQYFQQETEKNPYEKLFFSKYIQFNMCRL